MTFTARIPPHSLSYRYDYMHSILKLQGGFADSACECPQCGLAALLKLESACHLRHHTGQRVLKSLVGGTAKIPDNLNN
ncbi:MAG: hypothetical protein ACI9XK_004137 [Granulosicoccus sp.]|jgi:hypothetical protein